MSIISQPTKERQVCPISRCLMTALPQMSGPSPGRQCHRGYGDLGPKAPEFVFSLATLTLGTSCIFHEWYFSSLQLFLPCGANVVFKRDSRKNNGMIPAQEELGRGTHVGVFQPCQSSLSIFLHPHYFREAATKTQIGEVTPHSRTPHRLMTEPGR